jgi:hypothetical protein
MGHIQVQMHVQIGMVDVPKAVDLREVQWANTSSSMYK